MSKILVKRKNTRKNIENAHNTASAHPLRPIRISYINTNSVLLYDSSIGFDIFICDVFHS